MATLRLPFVRAAVAALVPLAALACGGSDFQWSDDGAPASDGASNGACSVQGSSCGGAATPPAAGAAGATGAAGASGANANGADAGAAASGGATSGGPTSGGASGATSDAGSGGSASSDAGAPAVPTLSDGQIFAVLLEANGGEVTEAKLAEVKAAHRRVRELARDLEHDHDEALAEEAKLMARLHVVPLGNDDSRALAQTTAQTLADLAPLGGDAFDARYVDAQVDAHARVLALIDGALLPSVHEDALREHLIDLRAAVATHLADAKTLRASLGP